MRCTSFALLVFLFTCFRTACQTVPTYTITRCTEQSAGYYFMTTVRHGAILPKSSTYLMIVDKSGELFYYRQFIETKCADFKMLPNGLISYFAKDKFYFMDPAFRIVDSVQCKNGLVTDHHDIRLLKNGHLLLLGTEETRADLSAHRMFKPGNCAGSPDATVTCGVIQELDENRNVVFEWHSKNYFKFKDMDTVFVNDPKTLDWTHVNALEEDEDGNILLSSRNFNEITKISRRDSSILWRLGGVKNQFAFTNDTAMFKGQHNVERLPGGHITLFDNGRAGLPGHPSVAKEYALDEEKRSATLVWSYVNDSASYSLGMGNVQRLTNGNTLINYGASSKSLVLFNVVAASGEKCFEMLLSGGLRSYRVLNYEPVKFRVKRPKIKCIKKDGKIFLDAGRDYAACHWSNNKSGRRIEVKVPGTYQVFVPAGDGGFISSASYLVKEL